MGGDRPDGEAVSSELRDLIDHAENREAQREKEILQGYRCPSCGMKKEPGRICTHGAQPDWQYAVKSPDGAFVWFPTEEAAKAHVAWRRSWARRLKVVQRKDK